MNHHVDEAYLKASAVAAEMRTVPVHLSDDEIGEYRAQVARLVIEQEDADAAFADVRDSYREAKKDRRKRTLAATKVLRRGYLESERMCYDVPDAAEGKMLTYDADGNLVSERRLKSSERQLTILTMPQRPAANEGGM
jgi:hypothetical protein